MARLVKTDETQSFEIPSAGEVTLGRGDQCDITIADGTMSRSHARIMVMEGRYVLTDLGSSNGTAVNGHRIAGPTEIINGSEVQFGTATFRFEVEPATQAGTSPAPALTPPASEAPPQDPVAPPVGMRTDEAPVPATPPVEEPAPPAPQAVPPPGHPQTAEPVKPPIAEVAEPPAEKPAAEPKKPAEKPAQKPAKSGGGVASLFAAPGAKKKEPEKKKAAPEPEPEEESGPRRIKPQALERAEAARTAEEERKKALQEEEQEAVSGPASYPKPPNRRNKCPTILQMEAVECGAASLAIILGYWGRYVPLEELRVECGVSRDGSKASNVLRAARKYGLEAKGFKFEDLDKLYDLDFPVILFWNFNHFLALEGFKGGKCYISDPATGPREITMEELDGSFSGVVLTFAPSETFEKGGPRPNITAALARRARGSEMALGFAVMCGLFLVIPGLIVPTFSRVFIDEVLVAGRNQIIKPLLGGMALIGVIQMVLKYLQEYYLLRMETKLALSTSANFFHHILRLPVTYFGQRFAGEIGERVMINDKVASMISGRLATTMLDCILIVFYAVLMFLYDVPLTLACIGLALVNVVAVKLASKPRIDAARRLMQEGGKMMGTAMNGLQTVETIKATGSEADFFGRWSGYQAKALKAEQQLGLIAEFVKAVPAFITTAITTVILVYGGIKVMRGELSIGMLVAYQTLMGSFVRPLNTFVNFGAQLQELQADMNRLDDVLQYPQDPQYSQEGKTDERTKGMVKLSGQVELQNVTFGYSPLDKPLIENFSLSIKPGQRVALVGGSGSGKSTVAKLVTGLYQLWEGEILLDGMRRQELPPSLIANSLGCVDQDIFLFGGNVRDNVTMWDSTIPVQRMTQAAKDAAIDGVIQTRDGAYNSFVEEGGGNFSGGQKQRLEIARALVAEPTILILDEATSALDTATERMIDEALRRRGCTCIIVAHRLSTIKDCDEIVVMKRGKIVQRGTHETLKDERGVYQDLISEH